MILMLDLLKNQQWVASMKSLETFCVLKYFDLFLKEKLV